MANVQRKPRDPEDIFRPYCPAGEGLMDPVSVGYGRDTRVADWTMGLIWIMSVLQEDTPAVLSMSSILWKRCYLFNSKTRNDQCLCGWAKDRVCVKPHCRPRMKLVAFGKFEHARLPYHLSLSVYFRLAWFHSISETAILIVPSQIFQWILDS